MTQPSMTTITSLQKIALFIVREHGPTDPTDLAYHWPEFSRESARAMLNRLERRGLVDAHYTSRRRARAFTISDRGAAAVSDEPKETTT